MSDTRWKTKQHRVIFILTEELIQEKQAGREITKSEGTGLEFQAATPNQYRRLVSKV